MSEWINVKDRLPSSRQSVVFYAQDREEVFAGIFNSDKKRFEDNIEGWWCEGEITHWMPLPEAPKD